MKKLICLVILIAMSSTIFAQRGQQAAGDDYFSNMEIALKVMKSARNAGQMKQAVKSFKHFTDVKSGEWLPPYYAAYAYTQMSFMAKNNKQRDEFITEAQNYITQAKERAEANAEVLVVQAYIHQLNMDADFKNRDAYKKAFLATLEKAEKIDASNPRILFLKAESAFFSNQKDQEGPSACELAQSASEKFISYKVEYDLAPTWGQEMTSQIIAMCSRDKK